VELRGGGKGTEKDSVSTLSQNVTSVKVEDIGCVSKAVEKWGVGRKRVRESNGGVELTKMKYIYSRDILRNPFQH
jgi:hypothetical protein